MRPALSHALYEMEEFHDRKLSNKQHFPETWGVRGWGVGRAGGGSSQGLTAENWATNTTRCAAGLLTMRPGFGRLRAVQSLQR